jgi:hypothetical protein
VTIQVRFRYKPGLFSRPIRLLADDDGLHSVIFHVGGRSIGQEENQ